MKSIVMTVLACFLVSCTPAEPRLRIGVLEWPPYEILRLAEHLDYLDSARFELVDFASPAEAERAYTVGGIDIVALTLDYLVEMTARDPGHRAFLIIDESAGGDAVVSREPVGHLAELAGKRIGVEASELGAYMLSRMLDKAGLTMADVEVVVLDIPDQVPAWRNGDVDAVVSYEPVRSRLLELGGYEVFSSKEIPGEIVDVFITRHSLIEKRGGDLRDFSRAWFLALRRWEEDPESFARLLAPNLDMSPQGFMVSIQGARLIPLEENRYMLGEGKASFLKNIQHFIDAQAVTGRDLPAELLPVIFTPDLLPQAAELR